MNVSIPGRIRRLLWDVDASRIDANTHMKIIVERVLNYGTLADWRWVVGTYGRDVVRKAAGMRDAFGRTNVRPESQKLIALLIG